MIKIYMRKDYWSCKGHGPKYICFCVSRMFDLIRFEQKLYSETRIPKPPRGSLGRAAKLLFENLAMNYPKHVKVIK